MSEEGMGVGVDVARVRALPRRFDDSWQHV
jgi:hypothetical protein